MNDADEIRIIILAIIAIIILVFVIILWAQSVYFKIKGTNEANIFAKLIYLIAYIISCFLKIAFYFFKKIWDIFQDVNKIDKK